MNQQEIDSGMIFETEREFFTRAGELKRDELWQAIEDVTGDNYAMDHLTQENVETANAHEVVQLFTKEIEAAAKENIFVQASPELVVQAAANAWFFAEVGDVFRRYAEEYLQVSEIRFS